MAEEPHGEPTVSDHKPTDLTVSIPAQDGSSTPDKENPNEQGDGSTAKADEKKGEVTVEEFGKLLYGIQSFGQ